MPHTDHDTGEVRTGLSDYLAWIGRGTADVDAADAIRQVVAACLDTGKVGTVTVTVKIKPRPDGPVEATAEVVAKAPRMAPLPSIAFVDGSGNLTRHDPDQLRMNVEGVDQ